MHRSQSERDESGKIINNERLEFLGDAIIEAVVSDIVFKKFNFAREGFLTTTRSKLVQRSALNELSEKLGLDKLVQFTRYSESHNSYIAGNAFEALVGAIYLDRGYGRCMKFIRGLIEKGYIKVDAAAHKEQNYKSCLLEWCQKHKLEVHFDTKTEYESQNNPKFSSVAVIEGKTVGHGIGYSKKESQQVASAKAMSQIKKAPMLRKALIRRKLNRLIILDTLRYLPEFEGRKTSV